MEAGGEEAGGGGAGAGHEAAGAADGGKKGKVRPLRVIAATAVFDEM